MNTPDQEITDEEAWNELGIEKCVEQGDIDGVKHLVSKDNWVESVFESFIHGYHDIVDYILFESNIPKSPLPMIPKELIKKFTKSYLDIGEIHDIKEAIDIVRNNRYSSNIMCSMVQETKIEFTSTGFDLILGIETTKPTIVQMGSIDITLPTGLTMFTDPVIATKLQLYWLLEYPVKVYGIIVANLAIRNIIANAQSTPESILIDNITYIITQGVQHIICS